MENIKEPTDRFPSKGIDPQRMQEIIRENISKVEANVGYSGSAIFPGNQICGPSMHNVGVGFSHYQISRNLAGVAFGHFSPIRNPSEISLLESVSFSDKQKDEIKTEVIAALENKNYDWRTIDGIVRETSLPKDEVCDMIKELAKDGIVVRAPYTDKKGRRIYTTRKHYHETIGPLGRLISAVTNRII